MLPPTPRATEAEVPQRAAERRNGLLRIVVPLLRGSLGVTFIWFGALKVAGQPTLSASMIAAITPFIDPDVSVPLMGGLEVALGAGLLVGHGMAVFLSASALHLSGTFLVLFLRPDVAFVDGNPLLLTVEGEYIVKNLVLLAAVASLALYSFGSTPTATKRLPLAEGRSSDHKSRRGAAA